MQKKCAGKSLVKIWKYRFLLILSFLLTAQSWALNDLRTDGAIVVEGGRVISNAIIGDETGEIFIEMLKDFYVADPLSETRFEGAILPPFIIDKPDRPPRARMREVLSFELFTDSNIDVRFVDRYSLMSESSRLRESILDPNLNRTGGAQFLTQIYDEEEIVSAALWQYFPSDSSWQRVGGVTTNSNEPGIRIFSATIYGTGVFTIWDENPVPTFSPNFPLDEIELAEPSPFPSVEATEVTDSADEIELLDDSLGPESEASTGGSGTRAEILNPTPPETEIIPAIDEAGLSPINSTDEPASPESEESLILFGNEINQSNLDLIQGVGLPGETGPNPLLPNATNNQAAANNEEGFSGEFLEDLEILEEVSDVSPLGTTPDENLLSSAPEIPETEVPTGALLPQTGQIPISPVPLLLFITFLVIIGGSFYLAAKKPY